jgi:hypothetical protein
MSVQRAKNTGAPAPITKVDPRRILPAVAQTVRDLLFGKRVDKSQVDGKQLGTALSKAADRLLLDDPFANIEQIAPAVRTLTHRQHELPHALPPDFSVASKDTPLDLAQLDPKQRYLWVLDQDARFILAPEKQVSLARKVNHGDLTPAAGGTARGVARAGGELYMKGGRWMLDLSSSYSFNRMDLKVLGENTLDMVIAGLAKQGTDITSLEKGSNVYDPAFRLAGFAYLVKYYLGNGAPK